MLRIVFDLVKRGGCRRGTTDKRHAVSSPASRLPGRPEEAALNSGGRTQAGSRSRPLFFFSHRGIRSGCAGHPTGHASSRRRPWPGGRPAGRCRSVTARSMRAARTPPSHQPRARRVPCRVILPCRRGGTGRCVARPHLVRDPAALPCHPSLHPLLPRPLRRVSRRDKSKNRGLSRQQKKVFEGKKKNFKVFIFEIKKFTENHR